MVAWNLLPLISTVIGAALAFSGAMWGASKRAYATKKGENLATHEDIDKLVDQVAAVTDTTKKIEAKISETEWNRQKRWELKREVLFEAGKRLGELHDVMVQLDTVAKLEKSGDIYSDYCNRLLEQWRGASLGFVGTMHLAAIICEDETEVALAEVACITTQIAMRRIQRRDVSAFIEVQETFQQSIVAARAAIRKELGIDTVPDAAGETGPPGKGLKH